MFAFTAVLALLTVANAAVNDCSRTANVVLGDTCDAISSKYGVSTFQLALVNNPEVNDACDNLVPDTEICLGESGMDCTKVYTVVAGDTCEWIQEMYGMTEDVLYGNNPQINAECTNIYIGEVLCVDTEKFDYPPYNLTAYEEVAQTYLSWCDEL